MSSTINKELFTLDWGPMSPTLDLNNVQYKLWNMSLGLVDVEKWNMKLL